METKKKKLSLSDLKSHLNSLSEIDLDLLDDLERMEIYCDLFQTFGLVGEKCGFGYIYNYSRAQEAFMSCKLGHVLAETYSGKDATTQKNENVEYKSTIGKKIMATYSGISCKKTWKEQREYLFREKIGKYPRHFFAKFNVKFFDIDEIWEMSNKNVLRFLLPKLRKQFIKYTSNNFSKAKLADPRLHARLTTKEIKKRGKLIMKKDKKGNLKNVYDKII